MALRTVDEYKAGLSDGRAVFYRGERVKDVVSDPELGSAVEHSALCYSIHDDRPDLAVTDVDGELTSYFWMPPLTAEDLVRRGRLIEEVSRQGGGMICQGGRLRRAVRAATGHPGRGAGERAGVRRRGAPEGPRPVCRTDRCEG